MLLDESRLHCRLAVSGWLTFCPFDGGTLELSGVCGGSPSLASSSSIRRSATSRRCHSARISAFVSTWLRRLRSGGADTPRLESTRP
jgi:hypothetical protein